MSLAAVTDEIGMRVIDGPRPGPLAARDSPPLLRKVRTCEMARQVGGREDQSAIVETQHQLLGRAGAWNLTLRPHDFGTAGSLLEPLPGSDSFLPRNPRRRPPTILMFPLLRMVLIS